LSESVKKYHVLILSIFTLLVFVTLFTLRSIDDNRLTSWRWVFEATDAGGVYLLLCACILPAWLLSRIPLPGRWLLFAASFMMAAVFWREPEVIVDASRYFTQAKHLKTYGVGYFITEWGRDIGAWTDMPLVPFIYGLIFNVFGESRIYIQIFTTMLFSFTVVIASMIGKDLWDDIVGLTAGALLLAIPYLYTQVPLMLVDVPSMFFLTLAVFAFSRALGGGPLFGALSVVAIVACVFSKYSLWPMLSVLVVVFIVRIRSSSTAVRGDVMRRGTGILLIAGLVAGAMLLYKYDVVSEQIRFLIEYQRPGLRRWTESFTSTFLFQVHPFVTAGALYSVYLAVKKRDIKYMVIAWLVALMVVMQVKRARYLIPVLPMYALMAAYGISAVRSEKARRFLVTVSVTVVYVLAVFAYMPFLEGFTERNLKEAGAYLDSLDIDRIRVFTLPQESSVNPAVSVPILDLHTDREIVFDYEASDIPLLEKYRESPLRFTWHYRNPGYYELPETFSGDEAVVVISGRKDRPLPLRVRKTVKGLHVLRRFEREGVFRFGTVVTVFGENH
jgi:uncharacterized membrane protein (GlpM family)